MSMPRTAYSDIEKRYVAHLEKYLFMSSDEAYNPADKRETHPNLTVTEIAHI